MARRRKRNPFGIKKSHERQWFGGSAASDHVQCLQVLDEFVEYVEQADACGDDKMQIPSELWPTYLKARKLVRDGEVSAGTDSTR